MTTTTTTITAAAELELITKIQAAYELADNKIAFRPTATPIQKCAAAAALRTLVNVAKGIAGRVARRFYSLDPEVVESIALEHLIILAVAHRPGSARLTTLLYRRVESRAMNAVRDAEASARLVTGWDTECDDHDRVGLEVVLPASELDHRDAEFDIAREVGDDELAQRILAIFAAEGSVPAPELAARLGVSRATITRALARLREAASAAGYARAA